MSTRDIRSSSGAVDHRPVVRTSVDLAGTTVGAEITLTRRDDMGFRMLLERAAPFRVDLVAPLVGVQAAASHALDHALAEAAQDGRIKPGDVVVIRYEGPKGGPGMQEMLYPTSYLKSKGLGKACALVTDGRFSGGTSGLSIGHCSPEAAEGGNIGLVEEGDIIEIDIPNRSIRVVLDDQVLAERRAAMQARGDQAWRPVDRRREVSQALRAYAALTTSAAASKIRLLSTQDPRCSTGGIPSASHTSRRPSPAISADCGSI